MPSREGEMEEKLADLRLLSEGQFRIGSNQSAVSLCVPRSHSYAVWAILGAGRVCSDNWPSVGHVYRGICARLKNQQHGQLRPLVKPPTKSRVLGTRYTGMFIEHL